MDWSLVLASQEIEHRIDRDDATGWVLTVTEPNLERALDQIRLYRLENRHWRWRQPVFQPGIIFDWRCFVWVLLNIFFYWWSETHADLRSPGIMDGTALAQGEWWRLFTAAWLHADVGHLATNLVFGFLLIGLVMGRYGPGVGLLAAYLAGVGGNLAAWWVYGANHRGLGASGVVMGALGLLVVQSVSLLNEIRPDVLWLDPALAYIGSDMNSQKDVGNFLRNQLAPLLKKYGCALIIIHHTNKISKDPEKQTTDASYLGAGSAEWINWSRAMLALRKTDVENLYELVAAKRGARLKWTTADGESLAFKKYIGHCRKPDTICWIEMAIADAEELRANSGKTAEAVLKHVPVEGLIAKEDLLKTCNANGIGKNLALKLTSELVENDELFECEVPRSGTRPKILLSREQVTLPASLSFDSIPRNSQGHYLILAKTEEVKKAL